jgi:type II pantothenate kinase
VSIPHRGTASQVKAKENEQALALLPATLAELDAIAAPRARLEAALRGVFAGNIFDLGAAASAQQYKESGVSFAATKARLLPRPWAVDELDALLDRCGGCAACQACRACGARTSAPVARGLAGWPPELQPSARRLPGRAAAVPGASLSSSRAGGGQGQALLGVRRRRRFAAVRHRKALLFVDNAGADVLLGMLPLARELLKRGTQVRAARRAAHPYRAALQGGRGQGAGGW